jgi:hypothetical protein
LRQQNRSLEPPLPNASSKLERGICLDIPEDSIVS